MPGISGIVATSSGQDNRGKLHLMVDCMMHERFYSSGIYINEELRLWSGWVNQTGSFSDCLPVWNEKKDICLIFSGEDFADPENIEHLRRRGHQCESTNAGYLIHLYEELGSRFFEKINGWFSGVLVDLRNESVVLFNDRYGLGRVYWHENERGFYFASEAKSLLKVLPNVRQLDLVSLGEFLSCGCVLQNRSLFSGVSLLPPGSCWTFLPNRPAKKETYFSPESWEKQSPASSEDYYQKLKETWARVVPRYLRGSDPVALSLTGGMDSRMIMAWAPSSPGTMPCYTFGGKYRDCADVQVAREVARICRQPHETIRVNGEFLSDFSTLAERAVYLSDGAMDVSGAIDLYIQRKARQISLVRMTGTSGGEILRRLVAFKPAPIQEELLAPDLAGAIRAAVTTYTNESQGHRLSFTAFKQTPWYMNSKFTLERSQLNLRMPYLDNDFVSLCYQSPPELTESVKPALRLIADGNPALREIQTDRGVTLGAFPGVDHIMHWFQQFTFKAEYAYDMGMPQWLAKIDHALSLFHLERLFLGRHKFHHFRVWYRDELSRYLKEMLLDARTLNRPYWRATALEKIVTRHVNGTGNYTAELHKVLSTEIILRKLIDQN